MAAMKTPHPLGVLMRTVREANGWSYRDVAERAEARGHKLSKSGVEFLEKTPPASMSIERVTALADALMLPERQIVAAFLASMGYAPERDTSTVEDAIRADGRLSTEDRQLLLDTLASLRKRTPKTASNSRQKSTEQDPAPDDRGDDLRIAPPGPQSVIPLRRKRPTEQPPAPDDAETPEHKAADRQGTGRSRGQSIRDKQDRDTELENLDDTDD